MEVKRQKEITDKEVIKAYERLQSVWKVGDELGIAGQSVHERLKKLGIKMGNRWTVKDDEKLIKHYRSSTGKNGELNLKDYAESVVRTPQFICRQAKRLGLTDKHRKDGLKLCVDRSKRVIEWYKNNEHPRGMLGKTHSQNVRKQASVRSKKMWQEMDDETRDGYSKRASINGKKVSAKNREKASWKCGFRIIGGKRKYYRSRWEANYARYLEWLKQRGEILKWQHEPKTFWFEGIKRGCVSYLPDFRVINKDGKEEYHEVKGWMDARSKTKIARMAKYYPSVKLIVIQKLEYTEIKNKLSRMIEGWED